MPALWPHASTSGQTSALWPYVSTSGSMSARLCALVLYSTSVWFHVSTSGLLSAIWPHASISALIAAPPPISWRRRSLRKRRPSGLDRLSTVLPPARCSFTAGEGATRYPFWHLLEHCTSILSTSSRCQQFVACAKSLTLSHYCGNTRGYDPVRWAWEVLAPTLTIGCDFVLGITNLLSNSSLHRSYQPRWG